MSVEDWKRIHGELLRLARSKSEYDADEARWLLAGVRVRVHERVGFATFIEYLERVFGYTPRLARERIRVAEALAQLPALTDTLSAGDLPWSAIRELTRVAVPDTEADWIDAARGKTVRQLEEMVSGRRPGDRPGDPADPSARRHILRLEVSADSLAAFRDARRQLEILVGRSLDDDETIRMLAHHALGGPGDPGRAAYQVAVTVCSTCRRGTRNGAGQEFVLEPHQVDAALCDAQLIDLEPEASGTTGATGKPGRAVAADEPGRAVLTEERETKAVDEPAPASMTGKPPTTVVTDEPRTAGVTGDPGTASKTDKPRKVNPAKGQPQKTELATHVGHDPIAIPEIMSLSGQATQTIPPRIRRRVWRRDQRSCRVPGCRSAKFLEIHHIIPRSHGGDHDPSRLVLLCGAHHGLAHRGLLRVTGTAPGRLEFYHRDGSPYGWIDRARAIAAAARTAHPLEADAIDGIKRLGFSAANARWAVAEAARSQPVTIEDLLRRALAVLGRTIHASRASERPAPVYSPRSTMSRRRPAISLASPGPAPRSGPSMRSMARPWTADQARNSAPGRRAAGRTPASTRPSRPAASCWNAVSPPGPARSGMPAPSRSAGTENAVRKRPGSDCANAR
jgi:hypothetical protein